MPKQYSSNYIAKLLNDHGFVFISQKGSHAKYRNDKYTVILPTDRKEIPLGTLRSILRQAGFDKKSLPR